MGINKKNYVINYYYYLKLRLGFYLELTLHNRPFFTPGRVVYRRSGHPKRVNVNTFN